MKPTGYDCICAGIVVADHVCSPVDRLPESGELVTTRHLELTVGGCASNTAVDLARLGVNVAVVGMVGQDVFGRFVRNYLDEAGVAVEHLAESEIEQTSGTLVINVRGEDRRFIHTVGANAEFDGSAVTDELIRSSRVLYLGGYCLCENPTAEKVSQLFQSARELGCITVLDVVIPGRDDDYWTRLKPVLPFTDVFLPNEDEAAAITGKIDPLEQAGLFHSAGAKCVAVTCGNRGTVLVSNELRLRCGVFDVEFIDGTGSGDAFTAGFIYGLLEEASITDCLRFGSALGANCVLSTGATTGAISVKDLRTFLQHREISIESL